LAAAATHFFEAHARRSEVAAEQRHQRFDAHRFDDILAVKLRPRSI
jgi:hypothetical protein